MPKTPAKTTSQERLILLDAHAILHRAYHALPDFMSTKGEPTGALYGLATMLIKIIQDLKPTYIVACYDLPQPTYRHEAYKDYKAGRKKAEPELVSQMKRSRDVFTAFDIPIYDNPGFEADDMLGTIVEQVLKGKEFKNIDVVIASGDMDTLQLIEGKRIQVYTLKKGIKDTILYDEEGVMNRFGFGPKLLPDYKGLRGDTSDNIIGIKGIGEKTGSILIQTFGTIENMYKELDKSDEPFKKVGITPRIIDLLKNGKEEAMFSKMLASIRRDAPIKFSLPHPWKSAIDMKKIDTLCADLDFRTLGARVREAISGKIASTKNSSTQSSDEGYHVAYGEGEGDIETHDGDTPETIDEKELQETLLALWVADSNKTNPTLDDIYTFAGVRNFAQAREIIFNELKKRGGEKILETIEKPLTPVLKKMQDYGIKIDVTYLKKLSEDYHIELEKIQKKIWEYAGEEFNVASPKQLGEILFVKMGLKVKNQKKTGTGAFSTKESELEKLRETHPIIEEILKYREFAKLLGTYIDVIPTLVDDGNRLHTTFIQSGAATGRMASENPGIQNIPNKTELGRAIRRAFIAEKGMKLLAFDYSQIELRIAAFLSGDEKLISIFKNGEDVHTAVASQVFGIPLDKVDKEMRRQAKVINFGVMYGMGVNALRQNLGTDRAAAQKFYDEYFAKFSGLATYLEKTKAETALKGYTETFFGRRRYFEGIRSKLPFIRASAERMAINAPIQGTEADIVKIAMIRVDEWLTEKKFGDSVRMLLQVHDELVFEVEEKMISKIVPDIQRILQSVIDPKETKGVVCTTEAKVGDTWEDMDKL